MARLGIASALAVAWASASEPPETTLEDRIRGAFLGTLVADALCLGSHYEYDAQVIKKAYGGKTISSYMAPGEQMGGSTHGVGWGRRNYHPGQKKGDQTDYGEYNLLMLEFFSDTSAFKYKKALKRKRMDLEALIPVWKARVSGRWGAWLCTQTKQTLQQVSSGASTAQLGGMSNAMSLRSGPLFGVFRDEDLAATASKQLMFTHRSPEALVGGEFFTRVTHRVVFKKMKPSEAIKDVCATMGKADKFVKAQCDKGLSKFKEVSDPSRPLGKEEFVDDLAMTSMARLWDVGKTEPIKVGKASPTEGTMPSSIYIILKYEHSLEEAAKANAMVGGDNASRAVAIGMVLGAYHGAARVPEHLKSGLNAWDRSQEMLGRLPLLAEQGGKEKAPEEL